MTVQLNNVSYAINTESRCTLYLLDLLVFKLFTNETLEGEHHVCQVDSGLTLHQQTNQMLGQCGMTLGACLRQPNQMCSPLLPMNIWLWDQSCDPNPGSTTPCAPLKQSGILAAMHSLFQPKASRILAKPARSGSPQ